jgi:hypothetical protein
MSTPITFTLSVHCPALDAVADELRRGRLIAAHQAGWPPAADPQGTIAFRLTGEAPMSRLVYEFALPPVPTGDAAAADIRQQELTLTVDNVAQAPLIVGLEQTTIRAAVPQGSRVSASFRYIDDAGNGSANPLVLPEFEAVDTIPPPDPVGGLGTTLIGEVADEPPVTEEPAPPADPPTDPPA